MPFRVLHGATTRTSIFGAVTGLRRSLWLRRFCFVPFRPLCGSARFVAIYYYVLSNYLASSVGFPNPDSLTCSVLPLCGLAAYITF